MISGNCLAIRDGLHAITLGISSTDLWWKHMWSLHIPPAVKSFAWKYFHNWLPMFQNLARHGMNIFKFVWFVRLLMSPLSPHYGVVSLSNPFESMLVLTLDHHSFLLVTFKDLLTLACSFLREKDLELLIVFMWRIWFRRNHVVHDYLMIHEIVVLGWCKEFLEDYKQAIAPYTRRQLLIPMAWT